MNDPGCKNIELPKKTDKQLKIPAVGEKEDILFYFHLSAIAIDFLIIFYSENRLGRGWGKVPKISWMPI